MRRRRTAAATGTPPGDPREDGSATRMARAPGLASLYVEAGVFALGLYELARPRPARGGADDGRGDEMARGGAVR
jgi:hypothetical protein